MMTDWYRVVGHWVATKFVEWGAMDLAEDFSDLINTYFNLRQFTMNAYVGTMKVEVSVEDGQLEN
jgi:hypothetical protein